MIWLGTIRNLRYFSQKTKKGRDQLIGAGFSSEILVCSYKTTRRYNPEDQHRQTVNRLSVNQLLFYRSMNRKS